MTDADEQGGLRFEINRKEKLAREAKAENLRKGRTIANE